MGVPVSLCLVSIGFVSSGRIWDGSSSCSLVLVLVLVLRLLGGGEDEEGDDSVVLCNGRSSGVSLFKPKDRAAVSDALEAASTTVFAISSPVLGGNGDFCFSAESFLLSALVVAWVVAWVVVVVGVGVVVVVVNAFAVPGAGISIVVIVVEATTAAFPVVCVSSIGIMSW